MKHRGSIGLWGAIAIGVGGMVGGGIFAVLGLSVQLAGGGAPIAFLVAGGVALLTAYSYSRLSVGYPGQGGTVEGRAGLPHGESEAPPLIAIRRRADATVPLR